MASIKIIKLKKNEMKTIAHYTGYVCLLLSLTMLLPTVIALIFNDAPKYFNAFVLSTLITFLFGLFLYYYFKESVTNLSFKGSLLFVSGIWFVAAFFSALPFNLSGDLSLLDSIYQGMSGITSTGFPIYQTPILPHSIALWEVLTQWIGGLGIILLLLVIIPSSVSLKRLYAAEGRTEQITSNIRHTGIILMKVYIILTSFGILLYVIAGLSLYDAICYSFTAIATGGFSSNPESVKNFSEPIIQYITMFLMLLGGINFVIHYKILKRDFKNITKDVELRSMFLIIAVATSIIFINLYSYNFYNQDIGTLFTHSLFQVISILTTSGFTSTELQNWPALSFHVLILLMFIGGSINSTSGGLKLYNIAVAFKAVVWETRQLLLPKNTVIKHRIYHLKDKEVTPREIRRVLVLIVTYITIFIITVGIILFYTNNFMHAYTFAAASLSNTGCGINLITPASPALLKIVIMIDFWIGRISIWPVLLVIAYFSNR